VLSVALVVVMVGFYWWFSGEEFYYPVDGQVRLADGTPVVGARVILQTDAPRFNANLITDLEGRYAYGTKKALGGAPAGTKYRVRIVPFERDYVVQMRTDDEGRQILDQVLGVMPAGTPVEERVTDGRRQLVINTAKPQTIDVEKGQKVEVRRANAVPERYHAFDSSGLELTIEARKNHVDLELTGAAAG
jgi:hypothetical protein